jgi:glycosyltransferase involved in cell wall biosynthesis
VNHTYMSFLANPARVGIYSQMFPNHPVSRVSHPRECKALSSYQLMLSNSSFTKTYADGYWEYPVSRSYVLTPPIGDAFVRSAYQNLGRKLHKQKKFVHVGRFNPGNHSKNQLLIIEAFLAAAARHSLLKDWELTLVGNVNQTPEALEYHARCRSLAERSNGRIRILEDLKQKDLLDQLAVAFGYIHGTGAFIPPGQEPHRCEHFGLSIVEAMAFGCIPLVYARGGIFDVLEPGVSGVPYIDVEGLEDGIIHIAHQWETEHAENMQQAAISAASKQSQDNFTAKLADYLRMAL